MIIAFLSIVWWPLVKCKFLHASIVLGFEKMDGKKRKNGNIHYFLYLVRKKWKIEEKGKWNPLLFS